MSQMPGKYRGIDSMEIIMKNIGICTTCVKRSVCVFFKAAEGTVFHCEEFDDGNLPLRKEYDASMPVLLDLKPFEANGAGEYRGLCSYCKNCKKCTYPKPEGGIWHCEEYVAE